MRIEVENEGPEEAVVLRTLPSPEQPTREEVERHNISHLPPRSWCKHCIKGRAVSMPHFKQDRTADARSLPCISMDYFFLGQDDGKTMPILAMKDHNTRKLAAFPVVAKGANEHAVSRVKDFIAKTGYRRLHLKDDQEPAILALKDAAKVACVGIEIIPEESPVAESEANGVIERGIQEIARAS